MSVSLTRGNPLDKRLIEIWRHMHARCENPKHKFYKYYGGRGVKVCEEWFSFVYFAAWAIQNGYEDKLELDRIDANGNYEPSNCRWITHKAQMNNRRSGEKVAIGKVTKSFSIRQRNKKFEYRINIYTQDGKRKQVTKCGFATRQEAIIAGRKKQKELWTQNEF